MKKTFRVSSCERKLLARVLSSLLQFIRLISITRTGKGAMSSAFVVYAFAKPLYLAFAHDKGTHYRFKNQLGTSQDLGNYYRLKSQLALVVNMDTGHVR